MGTFLEILIILFMALLTISLLGLTWAFIKKKRRRKPWVIRLCLSLLFLIASAVFYNNYQTAQEHKLNEARYQKAQQTAAEKNMQDNHFQELTTEKLNEIASTIAEKTETQNLKDTHDEFKSDLAMLNTKLDAIKTLLDRLLGSHAAH